MSDVVEVPVKGSDRPALIDSLFADRVLRYSWHLWHDLRSGRVNGVQATIGGKRVSLHRFVMGLAGPTPAVDHVNRDVLDNRHSNLRTCRPSQNQANRLVSRNSESGLKGVTRDRKSGLWKAQIYFENRYTNLGLYTTKEAAGRAYDEGAREHHRGFGRFNYPKPGERSALRMETQNDKLRVRFRDWDATQEGASRERT